VIFSLWLKAGWPFSGKSGKLAKVREFGKTWKKPGEVRESSRFFD